MSVNLPTISWEAIISNTTVHPTDDYTYNCTLTPININDPGYGILAVGYYIVDNVGHIFEIKAINGYDVEVYDLIENTQFAGPYNNKNTYVYNSLQSAALLAQAKLNRLDESAEDFVRSLGLEPSYYIPRTQNILINDPTGFDRSTPLSMGDMSFNDVTRTFTIQPKVNQTDFKFYINGEENIRTSAENVTIADTEGLWFIYYNSSGVLVASQTPWTFGSSSVFVAYLYWDATNKINLGLGEERHGISMDWATHEYLHDNFGTQWKSGFTPDVTVDGDGSLNAHAEIQSISAGEMDDEDIEHRMLEQTLYSIWYLDGAEGNWRKTTPSASAVAITTTRPDWNEWTGAIWRRTEVDNTKYTLTHMIATNNIGESNILVMGQAQYSSKADAREGADVEVTNIVTGDIPMIEFEVIATFIIECKDSYTNSYNARLISTTLGYDFVDWRTSEKTGTGASTNDHGNLTGLLDDDHTQYALDSYTNATPMPENVGGLEAGSTFNEKQINEMLTSILYPYQSPAFSAFTIDGQTTPLEVGDSIAANRTFTWTVINSANIEANQIVIRDYTGITDIAVGLAYTDTPYLSIYAAVQKTLATYNRFRITGTNTNAATFYKDYIVYWQWRVYYGESTSTTLNEVGIEGLRIGTLSSGFARTYSFDALSNGYKYISYPAVLGTATSFKDTATQLPVPMESVYTVSVANIYGIITNYNVHRSTNILNDGLNIIIT
jgi:hypothetical protein